MDDSLIILLTVMFFVASFILIWFFDLLGRHH